MFNLFTDREQVRRRKFKLENSKQEQFPPEVVARRRRLVPKLRDAKKKRQNVLDIIRYLVYRRHTCQYELRRRGGGVKLMIWNCNGLSAYKTENVGFMNKLLQNDVTVLLESWADEH